MENGTSLSLHQELNVTFSSTRDDSSVAGLSDKTKLFLVIMGYIQGGQYLMGFLVNVLTITSVVKFDYLHKKSTNLLILSLSIADGILGKEIV